MSMHPKDDPLRCLESPRVRLRSEADVVGHLVATGEVDATWRLGLILLP